jgi:hypothetical protein
MSVNIPSSFFLLAYALSTATIPWQSFCGFRLVSWSTTRAVGDRSSLDERPDLDHQIGDGVRPTWMVWRSMMPRGAAVIPSRELVMLTNGG